MAFICRNIDQASKLKIFPGVMLSEPVESYIKELADIHSIHSDSFAIVLLSFVAVTLEFSFVLRANSVNNKIPTNLFNIVVARSSFGKSDLTRILRDMLNTVVFNRPTKFRSKNQINLGSEGCSTGDIVSNMIIRVKSGACFDPAIGRFIFWPLDGPVIPDKLIQRQIDNKMYPSLSQFAIILSFIENSIFSFDEDAINEMIEWGNTCKQKSNVVRVKISSIEYFTLGFEERNTNESLSARLGKVVQHVYRIATFLQTIEIERQRQVLNYNDVAASIILFPSVCFTMKQLHESAVIHNHSGGGLLKQVITRLVETDLLEMCERGVKHASRTTCVYVKRLPLENDMDSQEQFSSILSEYTYQRNPISIDLYKKSCESMLLEAVGTVQGDVIQVLKRSEYGERDFSTFINLPKTTKPKTSLCNNQAMAVTTENYNLFQNIIDENAILTIGSSHVDHSTTSSSCSNFPREGNLFDNLNLVNQQPNLDSHNVIDVFHEQQSNNLNNIDLFYAEQSVDLNNLDTIRQQQPTDSEQNTNSDNNNIPRKGKKNISSTFFFSPTAGRTRSKLKIRKTQNQKTNGIIFSIFYIYYKAKKIFILVRDIINDQNGDPNKNNLEIERQDTEGKQSANKRIRK
ncbi:unnamed protein product [Rotaria magnacalcarata]